MYTYDFGVNIARGFVSELARTTIGVTSLVGAVYALITADNDVVTMMKRNQIAFGGYVNTLKAMQWTSEKIASGKSPFDQEDIMHGLLNLKHAGIDVKKNFDLVNKAAIATGASFDDIAQTIRTGNFQALSEMGIISDRMAISMERWGFTQVQAAQKVKSILEMAEKKNMFAGTIKSIPQLLTQIHQINTEFMRAIVGDPKDPNGFMFGFRKGLQSIADGLYKMLDKVRKVGTAIGAVLRFAGNVIWDFAKRVSKNISTIFGNTDKFFENFAEKMHSFQLYLAITRSQINSFFDKYGDSIKKFMKVALTLLAFKKIGNALTAFNKITLGMTAGMQLKRMMVGATTSADGFYNAGVQIIKFIPGLLNAVVTTTEAMLAFFGISTPVGWLLGASAAILLLASNWDDVKSACNKYLNTNFSVATKNVSIHGKSIKDEIQSGWVTSKTNLTNYMSTLDNLAGVTMAWTKKLVSWIIQLPGNALKELIGVIEKGAALIGVKLNLTSAWQDRGKKDGEGWGVAFSKAAANKTAQWVQKTNSLLGTDFTYSLGKSSYDKAREGRMEQVKNAVANGESVEAAMKKYMYGEKIDKADLREFASTFSANSRLESNFSPTSSPTIPTTTPQQEVKVAKKKKVEVDYNEMSSASSQKVVNVNQGAIVINAQGMSIASIKAIVREVLNEPDKGYRK